LMLRENNQIERWDITFVVHSMQARNGEHEGRKEVRCRSARITDDSAATGGV
jgi:hypothetical protein